MNRKIRRFALSFLIVLLVFLNSCGIQQAVVRKATGPIIDGGFAALMAEDDIELAKTSIESNLKLVEGLIHSDPGNTRLLLVAAQGFTAYALGFAEDENPERAVRLYLRARDYANRWLIAEHKIDLLEVQNLEEFQATVANLPDKAMPGVFWLGNSWASALLLSLTDMASVTNLPKVESLMQFALNVDETYYFGGSHLFFGGYYGSRSAFLGGSPIKAKEHLERQIEITDGQVLLGHLFMVKYVDLPALDGEAAEKRLNYILEYDLDSAPEENRLINRIAQLKAKKLLLNLEDYL